METLETVIGREEAKAKGMATYFSGKPCLHGNKAERLVSNRHCTCLACKEATAERTKRRRQRDPAAYREKQQAHQKKHRTESREKVLSAKRRYRVKNREKILAAKRLYREERRDTLEAYRQLNRAELADKAREYRSRNPDVSRRYRQSNRHIRRAWSAERRAVERQRRPSWFGEFDHFVMVEAAQLAADRGAATGLAWHVDHAIPLAAKRASGLHCGHNLQVIPMFLNVSKLNRMVLTEPDEWLSFLS
jgi:hypothetical protein